MSVGLLRRIAAACMVAAILCIIVYGILMIYARLTYEPTVIELTLDAVRGVLK